MVVTRGLCPGLVDAGGKDGAPIGLVLADAEFDSEANHQHIRRRWGSAQHYPGRTLAGCVPPRSHPLPDAPSFFHGKHYGQRAKIETIFSVVKNANFLYARLRGAPLASQIRQALAARSHLQPLSLEAPDEVIEDVNRATSTPLFLSLTKNRGGGGVMDWYTPRRSSSISLISQPPFPLSARPLSLSSHSTPRLLRLPLLQRNLPISPQFAGARPAGMSSFA